MCTENSSLRRIYLFSDTYGRSKSPFDQDDADTLISTDFRSFPLRTQHREFDIYGREAVVPHMIRLIFALHKEIPAATYLSDEIKEDFSQTKTGIFINAAPRTDTKENGAPFYVAENGNIRIVTTDPAGLSSIKDQLSGLWLFPNADEALYGPTEQFRSSFTPRLLEDDHGMELQEQSLDVIPDFPEDRWELAYIDRFGNIMTYTKNPEKRWKEILEKSKEYGGYVKLILGNVSQRAWVSTSLKDADPGALAIYPNGDIDIVRKWEDEEDRYMRLFQSAYFQYAKPDIGSKIKVR